MMLQVAVKKAPLKPSGPGELFFLREKTAALISSEKGMEVRKELSEAETLGLLIWKREGLGWLSRGLNKLEKKSTSWAWILAWSSVIEPFTEIWWIELKELLAFANR